MSSDANLKMIVEGPVYLLEGNDGMIYCNSQWLAKEVLRLRESIRTLILEARLAALNGCNLSEKAIVEWGRENIAKSES